MNSRILIVATNNNFPRLAGIADDAAALRLHFTSKGSFSTHPTQSPAIGRQVTRLPSTDGRGGAA